MSIRVKSAPLLECAIFHFNPDWTFTLTISINTFIHFDVVQWISFLGNWGTKGQVTYSEKSYMLERHQMVDYIPPWIYILPSPLNGRKSCNYEMYHIWFSTELM